MLLSSFASLLLNLVAWNHDLSTTRENSSCSSIAPIRRDEFLARQTGLALALHALNASAYITEPSANSQYYANFSSVNWKLSERPLLLIVRPKFSLSGDVEPDITLLTPKVRIQPHMTTQRALTQPFAVPVRNSSCEWSASSLCSRFSRTLHTVGRGCRPLFDCSCWSGDLF